MNARRYRSVSGGALRKISFVCAVTFHSALFCACSRQSPEAHGAVQSNPEAPVFQRWKAEDFGGVLSVGLEGHRSFLKGEKAFVSLGCNGCHQILADTGSPNGAPERISLRYTIYSPEDLLAHILCSKPHFKNGQGLLNDLEQDGVLDLLAYILSGADGTAPFFIEAR